MPEPSDKPFAIPKQLVWEAYRRVAANKGAPGVDGQALEEFEADLADNLYKIWNRMSSGSYFPPPVKAVEIPKPHGGGTRVLGVPTVADRIAQAVAAMYLEPLVEPRFHPDSYGYRPGKAALDAVEACRRRCWKYDWVIDLDVQKFFDTVPWDLVVRAVRSVTDCRWVLLYVNRWLEASVQQPDGTVVERDKGTPQGSAISPVLANLFMHYAFECATNVKRGDAVGSHLSMQCSTEDGGSMALRHRPMGDDVKPPHAALVSDRRGERCGKGALDASGGDHGDDRC
jgi:group II intron reverse transcriptase/maturase